MHMMKNNHQHRLKLQRVILKLENFKVENQRLLTQMEDLRKSIQLLLHMANYLLTIDGLCMIHLVLKKRIGIMSEHFQIHYQPVYRHHSRLIPTR